MHDAEHMAMMRSARGPFTDPRQGRIFLRICRAFLVNPNEAATTRYLMSYCYPRDMDNRRLLPWRRRNVIEVARKVAIPRRYQGKGAGQGRPYLWIPIEGALEERTWVGRSRRRQARKGQQPPPEGC